MKSKKIINKKIVTIGGGTGQFSLLSGLKKHVKEKENLKAIVTTFDNGGSSGKLITQFGTLPPGDIRNCILALSEETQTLIDLFNYRFKNKLENHNFGNLFLTTLSQVTGSFEEAITLTSKILNIKGEVIPVSLETNNNLIAKLNNQKILIGETIIDKTLNKKILELSLQKKSKANPKAINAIKKADLIILGPGDLYTSILPNVLFPEIKKALKENKKAKKIFITPIMSKPGETDNFKVSDFIKEVEKYIETSIDYIIVNTKKPKKEVLEKYEKENKFPIFIDYNKNLKIIKANLLDKTNSLRHNPKKLASVITNKLITF